MKAKRVSNYQVYNEVLKLQKKIEYLEERLIGEFKPIDSLAYIQYKVGNYKVAWLYKGVYYANPNKLYDKIVFEQGYTKKKDAFKTLLGNSSRQDEMWPLEINYVLLEECGQKHYVSSVGHLLSKASLNIIQTMGNTARFVEEGETIMINLGVFVYTAFIDENHVATSMRHLDSNLSNNVLYNLAPHSSEYAAK
jgi:hypothetical protein